MSIKKKAKDLVVVLKKYKHILIYIKGSPDPDVMASSYALKLVCEAFGIKATIDSPTGPSLPQNIKIVKDLHLPIQFESQKESVKMYDAYAILDHPTVEVLGITGIIPCAIHIDHHQQVEDQIPVDFKLSTTEAGSTSSLMVLIMEELKEELMFSRSVKANLSTALYFGMKTDTNNFQYKTDLEEKALSLIDPYTDKSVIRQISGLSFHTEGIHLLQKALHHKLIHKEWLISGIGFIKEKHRDIMAIIGDFLLQSEDVTKVMVFSIVEKKRGLTLDACFRTKIRRFNLAKLIKKITSEGGARPFKGAFQVNLDYFIHCPDREFLWELVYLTTVEALKKEGIGIRKGKIKRMWSNLATKIRSLFKP